MPSTVLYPILSLLLMAGGVALALHAARAGRKLVAARVDMIAPATAETVHAPVSGEGAQLVRRAATGKRALEIAEVARVLHKLKLDPRAAAVVLTVIQAAAIILLGLAAFALMRMGVHGPKAGFLSLVGAAIGAILGWFAPAFVMGMLAGGRRQSVVNGFPEALELMVVCVEAGLALEESIDRIADELSLSQPELAEELQQTSADLKILPDRDQALRNMADRIGAPSVRSVMTTLSQTLRYGTPLAQGLRVAASELRNDSMLDLEERANRLPTLMTLPMMLCIMPTIFLVVAGPAVIRVMDVLNR